jgi:hypothetical protein
MALTYTQAYTRAAYNCGLSLSSLTDITFLQQDVNQGLRLFKNAARRYWTRKEVTTNMVSGQQYYTFPVDMVRITEVKVNSNGLNFPVILINSEHFWNKLNIIPAMTINLPTYAFVRGRNEVGLWPTPSSNTTNGIIVSYEPRLIDMSIDDILTTATVNSGSTTVTGTGFSEPMIGRSFSVTDGSDGNWYNIAGFNSSTSIELENVYQGITGSSLPCIIGQLPDIPEDYHMALPYYASMNFYLKRKDTASAQMYQGMFTELRDEYKKVYSAKSTGLVMNAVQDYRYSLFSIPPNPIS